MQYLIISDIHANLEALDATVAAAPPCDHVLVLGDLVGYGADPNAVVDRIRLLPSVTIIRGNHDKVAAGLEGAAGFNHLARHAVEWTRTTLTPGNRDWIARLPAGPIAIDSVAEICHGTPFDEDVYLFDDMEARRAFRVMSRPVCLFGHTHVPTVFRCNDKLEAIGPPRGPRFALHRVGRRRLAVSGELRCGRSAARRRFTRGVRRARYADTDADGDSCAVRSRDRAGQDHCGWSA
jgi:predicted phosphodiesterase